MSDIAIVSHLWQNNIILLQSYLSGRKRVVLIPEMDDHPALTDAIRDCGGIPVVLESLVDRGVRSLLLDRVDKLIVGSRQALASEEWKSFCTSHNVKHAKLSALLETQIARQVGGQLLLIEALNEAVRRYSIEAMIINEDYRRVAKTMVLWARQVGVPSFHLEHAMPALNPYTVHEKLDSDWFFVSGERAREAYLDVGYDAERMVVTGFPAADAYVRLAGRKKTFRKKLVEKYGLNPDLPIVMFGTTWSNSQTGHSDAEVFTKTVEAFFVACQTVMQQRKINILVKDRYSNVSYGETEVAKIAANLGMGQSEYTYLLDPPDQVLPATDVLISVNSALSVEAMLAGVPAINLVTALGLRFGPCFGVDSGCIEAEPEQLASAILDVLENKALVSKLKQDMVRHAPLCNLGVDGKAGKRVLKYIEKHVLHVPVNVPFAPCIKDSVIAERFSVDAQPQATGGSVLYRTRARGDMAEMFKTQPRLVLDAGCAEGGTGAILKHKYPGTTVIGVESDKSLAVVARGNLDSVIEKHPDNLTLEDGIALGSVDGLIMSDQCSQPWRRLSKLKKFLSLDAMVVFSIRNPRNLIFLDRVSDGHWDGSNAAGSASGEYCCTLSDIREKLNVSGFQIVNVTHNIDSRLRGVFESAKGDIPAVFEYGRLAFKNLSLDEFNELCSQDFLIIAKPLQNFSQLEASNSLPVYQEWQEGRKLPKYYGPQIEARMREWADIPKIHVLVYALPYDEARIASTITSLAEQIYFNVRLSVLSTGGQVRELAHSDRIEWFDCHESNSLDEATRILAGSDADWCVALNAGDRVAPNVLFYLMEAAFTNPAWAVMYTDEDVLDSDGKWDFPHFKPDINLDMLRSYPYAGGLMLVKKTLFAELGGFDQELLGVEEYDFLLRAIERSGTEAVGHLPDIGYHRLQEGGHCRKAARELVELGRLALSQHLARANCRADVEHGLFPGSYRVKYMHEAMPLVSILIVARNSAAKLQNCLESLLEKTHYPNYELLLLDAESDDGETSDYLRSLNELGEERLRVYSAAFSQGLPRLYNVLAAEAKGEYLLYLHFDGVILQNDWLNSLMSHAMRPEVGVVSPRVVDADGNLLSGAVLLGMDALFKPAFLGRPLDYPGYFGRAHLEQNFTALQGGCLLLRKSLFGSLGGFEVEGFDAPSSEVDFVLRSRQLGYLAVWTPYVTIMGGGAAYQAFQENPHDGGKKEGEIVLDENSGVDSFKARWLNILANDPSYNKNLCLDGRGFEIETRGVLSFNPLPWRPLPLIVSYPADKEGCGEYRIIAPSRALVQSVRAQVMPGFCIYTEVELERLQPDSIILQRQTEPHQIESIRRYKRFCKAFRVYEIDDLITNVSARNPHSKTLPKDVAQLLRKGVELCDRFVVATEMLAETYRELHTDIRVVKNYLEYECWGQLKPVRADSRKARVGWAGSVSHLGDLEMFSDVVKALSKEVDWIFLGICPNHLLPYVREFHPGVQLWEYPAKLASLNLDLAVAPLEIIPFNECKSHLKLLEYGILGYPVIATDIAPYRGGFPVKLVKNNTKDWCRAIREMVADRDACARAGKELKDHVEQSWLLENNLDVWLNGWLPEYP
jgi:GT2 family glycosyltransferase